MRCSGVDRLGIGFAMMGIVVLSAPRAHAQISTTNLLTNPGAEAGSIAGWTSARADGNADPNVDNGSFDSGISPNTGMYDFYGGNNSSGTLTQAVSLVGTQGITAAQIDTGTLNANVSFFEQGLNQGTTSDDASVTLLYVDANGNQFSSATTATIDSHDNTWAQDTEVFVIPTGTRTIDYQINFMRNHGLDNDSFIDDTGLSVFSNTDTSSLPEPSAIVFLVTAMPLGGLLHRRRWHSLCNA